MLFRVPVLVQVYAEVIQRKKCVCYAGWFEGVRPVIAMEGRMREIGLS